MTRSKSVPPSVSESNSARRHQLKFKREWASSGLYALSAIVWSLVAILLVHRGKSAPPLDFQGYRDAANNMLRGGATYREHFTLMHLNFTYPPLALLLLSALTVLPTLVVLAIWWLLSSVALVLFVVLALESVTGLTRSIAVPAALILSGAALLLLEPVRSSMDFGQINFFLMLAILVDLTRVRSSAKGVLTGLAAAVKLTPLIYIAYFVVSRSRLSTLRAVGAFVGATAVAWLVLPSDSALFWFHQAFIPGHKGRVRGTANQSWLGLVDRFSSTLGYMTIIVWLVLSAATFLLGYCLAKRYIASARPIESVLALALTELLVSPISWAHHWSWIILLPVLLFARRRQSLSVSAAMLLLLAVAIAAPYRWFHYRWYDHGLLAILPGYSLFFAGVLLLITMAGSEWRRAGRERSDDRLDHILISKVPDG